MPVVAAVDRVMGAVVEVFTQLDALCGLPGELLTRRPGREDAWTIAEHLEHVALADRFLLLTIGKGCRTALKRKAAGAVAEGESDLGLLAAIADPDAFAWAPPRHMIPTGLPCAGEIREQLENQRKRCVELLESMREGEGRLCRIRMSVNRSGWLDMYQWLYFLVQHARYHVVLIERVMDELSGR
ncbi:DinB family protein [Geomonas sp. Red32]|uniref:DinB family protein n=1 Tax=Geomonas sp. Red32 TaxID=2912856 RepID=UPI00202CF13E|nr:DinB family protein [Geomonas sp. Red32]MCM0082352.1 DinB family protein [Geomonas sp. Red32]